MLKRILASIMACVLLFGTLPVYAQTAVQTDVNLTDEAELSEDIEDLTVFDRLKKSSVQPMAEFDNYFKEAEPNDIMEDAEMLSHDDTFWGEYSYGDVDIYGFYLPERYQINMILAAQTDTLLCRLLNNNGRIPILDAKIVEVENAPSERTYYNLTMELPSGNYYLALTDFAITTGSYEYEMYFWTECTSTDSSPFLDVTYENGKVYYYDPVLWAYENEIVAGTSAITFGPEEGCTRGQAMTFIWRAAQRPEASSMEHSFLDVEAGSYYEEPVLWAVENGITYGMFPTLFGPNEACTRAQIVTFLWRAAGKPEPSITECPFKDVANDAYFKDAVQWAVENGITSGTSATTFGPNENCTRAQIVTFLYRIIQNDNNSEIVL